MRTTSKAWQSGSSGSISLVISKNIRNYYGIQKGDLIEIEIVGIFKKADKEENNKKLQRSSNEEQKIDATKVKKVTIQ